MVRLLSNLGVHVDVDDRKVDALIGMGYARAEGEPAKKKSRKAPSGSAETTTSPHAKLTVEALKAEIASRNEGREDDARLSDEGNKPALVAVLDADDAAAAAREADEADGSGDE